jgi:ketosteroid isomerase-like protein
MKQLFMLRFLLVCFAWTILTASAQTDSLQRQINEHVWKPFIQAFKEQNTEQFMSVHSRSLARVDQDGKKITGYEKYYSNNQRNNAASKEKRRKVSIELRFTQRIASSDKAFEVGYYKFTSTSTDGKVHNGYGKFHVLLQKENGTWKIVMDADTNEGATEEAFLHAAPLE